MSSGQTSKKEGNQDRNQTDRIERQTVPVQVYPSIPSAPPLDSIIVRQPVLELETIPLTLGDLEQRAPHLQPIDCPPGLECLTTLNGLLVCTTNINISGSALKITFQIKNSFGREIYHTRETSSSSFAKLCSINPFALRVIDNNKREVIRFHRPSACNCCICSCLQKIEVFSPPGVLIGTVQEEYTFCYSSFTIRNINGEVVLRVDSSCCLIPCFSNSHFRIMTPNRGLQVGELIKVYNGFVAELNGDYGYKYKISFPLDLDVKMKASILGACFLIDDSIFKSGKTKLLSFIIIVIFIFLFASFVATI